MFDKYIVCEDSFRRDGDRVVLDVRMPYYRGLGLSMVEAVNVSIDGEQISSEATSFTVHGNMYTFAQLPDITDDRWEMGERAQLHVRPSSRLADGEHEVTVDVRLRISYMPVPGGGRDTKRLMLSSATGATS
jgi:hypothetical protein